MGLVADAEGVAIAAADPCQGEGSFAIEGLDAGREVTQDLIGDRHRQINLDAADGIDDVNEGLEIDHAVVIDGDPEIVLNGFCQGVSAAAFSGVAGKTGGAEKIGLIDLEGVLDGETPLGHLDDQVSGQGEHVDGHLNKVDPHQTDDVRQSVFIAFAAIVDPHQEHHPLQVFAADGFCQGWLGWAEEEGLFIEVGGGIDKIHLVDIGAVSAFEGRHPGWEGQRCGDGLGDHRPEPEEVEDGSEKDDYSKGKEQDKSDLVWFIKFWGFGEVGHGF